MFKTSGMGLNVTWDTNYLTLISKQEGSFLNSQYQTLFTPSPIVDVAGAIATDTYKEAYLSCAIDTFSNGEDNSVSGSGVLASMTFQIMRQTGSTPIALGVVLLEGPNPSIDTTGTAHPQIVPASYFSTSIVSLEIAGAPTANAGEDQTVPVGTPVVFNASQSVSTGTNTNYTWTFTDVTPQTLTGKTATYTFNNPGNYTVTLTVTDSLGTDNSTVIISVTGKPATPTPTATATPNTDSTSTPTTTTATIDLRGNSKHRIIQRAPNNNRNPRYPNSIRSRRIIYLAQKTNINKKPRNPPLFFFHLNQTLHSSSSQN